MSPTSLESVAVATVAYNSSSHLGPFLSSLREGEDASLTVIVADNGSRDIEQTREFTREYGAQLLELDQNLGYGGAVNAAVRAMPERIRYVLVSNPDVLIEPGAVTALVRALERLPEAGAVGPRVLNEDGTVYPSARKLPSLRTGVGHALFGGLWPSNPWTRSYREDQEGSEREREVGWLSGSFVMVSAKLSTTSVGSMRASSCTSRMWISGTGSASTATGRCTCRAPRSCTRAPTRRPPNQPA
ncbi:glycosyltransferase [Leifsonia poae]|uniref:glycosyltransferase n=1 Tax=Leifsonia poae TaxID=110933 RepID=UPI003D6763BB